MPRQGDEAGLDRREAIAMLGSVVAIGVLGAEGPYFVDEMLNRSDIRTDPATGVPRPGVPLDLTLAICM